MLTRQTTFILFSLTVVFVLMAPDLVQHGMFMDGMQYACIAKNMAAGKGSFWLPYLSASWQKVGVNAFLEHPPLSYYLQSFFFRLFGTSVFTEKFYCFFLAVLCAYLLARIWKLIFKSEPALARYWWLAVLLWFATPSVFWSFRNNLIENPVSLMVLAATYFALRAILSEDFRLLNVVLSSLFIFSGSLCKGFPALFPLSIFLCWYLCFKTLPFKKTLLYSFILLVIPALIYTFIYVFNDEARYSLDFYLENRLLKRVTHDHLVENRFTILFWLLTDEFVNIGIALLLILSLRWRTFRDSLDTKDKKLTLFFFLYGMCGVLPLCLTHVQRAAYFVPALPFFAFVFAIFFVKGIHAGITRISDKQFRVIRIAVLVFSLFSLFYTFAMVGQTARDEDMLEDVHKISAAAGNNKFIGTSSATYNRWDFQFYLLRYHDNVLFTSKKYNEPVLIMDKGKIPPDNANYTKQNIRLNNPYDVYVKN